MKRFGRFAVLLLALSFGAVAFVGCEKDGGGEEGEHAVVESGTYTGTIAEVNADEKEIYVNADGKELELYFIDETELTRDGETVEFSTLEKGQKVEVEIKKVGKRLDPLTVKIVE
ncbi:MAG: hypothetical protein ACQEVA_10400 [Myxococcota bacterium]